MSPAPEQNAAAPPPERLSTHEREQLVTVANHRLGPGGLRLEIQIDEQTGSPVIRMVDASTGEMLLQIPDEAKLKRAQEFAAQFLGQLIDQTL